MFAGVEYSFMPARRDPSSRRVPHLGADTDKTAMKGGHSYPGGVIYRSINADHVTVPEEALSRFQLRELQLSSNQITAVPTEISRLTNLTTLLLDCNAITSLPPELGLLTKLTVLNLAHNAIETLPPTLGKLLSLRILNLTGNPLTGALSPSSSPLIDIWNATSVALPSEAPQPQARPAQQPTLKARTAAMLHHLRAHLPENDLADIQKALHAARQHELRALLLQHHVTADAATLEATIEAAQQAGIKGRELKAAQVALEYTRKLCAAVAAKDRESMQIAMRAWRAFAGTGYKQSPAYQTAVEAYRDVVQQAAKQVTRSNFAEPAQDSSSNADTQRSPAHLDAVSSRYQQQKREKLRAAGACTYEEWLAAKEQQDQSTHAQIQNYRDKIRGHDEGRLTQEVEATVKLAKLESRWPSAAEVEPLPPGTFAPDPRRLATVRRMYSRILLPGLSGGSASGRAGSARSDASASYEQ